MKPRSYPTGRLTRLAAGSLTVAALVLGTAPGQAATPAPAATADKAGWHRLATLMPTSGYARPTLDVTANGHWLTVAQGTGTRRQRDTAMLVRGRGNGHVDRFRYRSGKVLAHRIDRAGDVTAIANDSGRGLVAVTWAHDRARPRLHTLTASGASDLELLANKSGDLAIHWVCGADKRCIIRKPAGEGWARELRVGGLRYDGSELADVAIDGRGRLVGAFLDDVTISLRTLAAHGRVFGRPHEVLSVPEYASPRPGYDKHATIAVGPGGDRVVSLSLREVGADNSRYGHTTVLVAGGGRWDGDWADGNFDDAVVGASGRVTFQVSEEFGEGEVLQWLPGDETFRRISRTWLTSSSPRGDLLLTDLAPNDDRDTPGHFSALPDGRRALDPIRAVGGPLAPTDVVGRVVYVAEMTHTGDRWVLTRRTIRS